MKSLTCKHGDVYGGGVNSSNPDDRRVSEDSILAVQIFDQKKFKKKDQGFLGVINVRVGDVIDFSSDQERRFFLSPPTSLASPLALLTLPKYGWKC
jgi:hypothetical protein